ncbi:MAG: hypothetical protein RH862_14430 [Leptospiraceae bacterium]
MNWIQKSISFWLILNFLTIFVFPPGLVAEPFRDFDGEDKKALESYLNRATNMQDLDQWRSYVQAGLISLKADWEEDAAEEIQDRQDRIREDDLDEDEQEEELDALDTEYETARIDWETEASQLILEREADFRVKQENIEGLEISEQEYQEIISTAEAAFENNPELELDSWESLVEGLNESLVEAFETDLEARIAEARDNIGPLDDTQIEALDQAIAEKEAEIRNKFEMREHFYLLKAKNRYIALKRSDDLSAKVQSESGSAEEIGDQAIENAQIQVEEQTAALLEQSEEALNSQEGSPDPLEYQRQVEEIISQGLQVFEEAEEDLYQDRLVWMEATKTSRAEAEEIWKEEHEKLKSARDDWLEAVRTKIEEGRAKYAAKYQEFEENRAQAEADLQDYIDQERDRWNGSSEQLASMVRGGGAALLEAKEAQAYYQELLELLGDSSTNNDRLKDFYTEEEQEMAESIDRFELILLRAQEELHGTLYSEDSSSGLLNDQRQFGEDLREELEEFDEETFREKLLNWLANEENRTNYALYVRDMESDIRSNRLFVERAQELQNSQDFNYEAMDSIQEIRELVAGLDKEYLEHGIEITKLINDIIKQKGGAEELWPEDVEEGSAQDQAAKQLREQALADIKTAIASEFFNKSTEEDLRLRELILGKLEDGLYRQHITGNANDPYLMTDAKYEWEVLRRERDRQAQRLERARRVKHYADIAEKHGAGLEMAAVTDWRVQASKTKTDLLQLAYDVTAGEAGALALQLQGMDPDADPAAYEALIEQLIQEQTDFELYAARGENLQSSSDFISDVAGLDAETVPDVDDVNEMLAELGTLLAEFSGDDASAHPLLPFRSRLQSFRDEILSGNASASTLANRWKALHGTARALSLEMEKLAGEFNYSEERELIRTALSQPNLKQRSDALGDLKDDLESTTDTLRLAEERLNESREAYKQARIDLEIQNSGEAQELIQIELRNAASALGAVMTQMKSVEDAADIPLQTQVESAKDDYFDTIREKNESAYNREQTRQALGLVEALNNTVQAGEALRDLQSSEDYPQGAPAPENVQARAEAILEIKEDIAKAASPTVSSALSSLQGRLDLLESLQETIDDEDVNAEEKAHAEDQKQRALADLEKDITRLQDVLKSTEEAVRLALLKKLDREPDESEVPTNDELKDRSEELRDDMLEFAELVAGDLKQFLTDHRGNSYSAMIAASDSDIATAVTDVTADGEDPEASETVASLRFSKDWIIDSRDLIDAANEEPDSDDPTPKEKRWDALLAQLDRVEESSTYWLEFENSKPESSGDAWVTEFRTEREDLRDTLDTVLSSDDANIEDVFYGLNTDERELLLGYSGIRTGNSTYLRRDLNQIRDLIQRDLDQLDTDFELIFEREEAKNLTRRIHKAQKELAEAHPEYGETQARINLLRTQLLEMREAIDGAADATERGNLEAKYASDMAVLEERIEELQDIIDAAKPDVEARQAEIRRLSAYLQELKQGKGSSSQFMNAVSGFFEEEMKQLNEDQQKRQILDQDNNQNQDPVPVIETLGLALGVFVPDIRGEARKSGDTFLISDDFASLGLTDVESIDDIAGVLNESLPGPVLEALSENLLDYASNPDNSGRLSEEMQAAIMMLQGHLIEVAAAREIIDMRDSSVEEIKDRADRMKRNSAHLQEVLPAWKGFEDQLMEALQNGASPSAILAILDSQENFELLEEEARRNVDGDEKTDVPEAIAQRLSLYEDAHELLRNYKADQVLASALSSFQSQLQAELNPSNDFEAERDPEYYLNQSQNVDFEIAISRIENLADSGSLETLKESEGQEESPSDPDSDETLRSLLTAKLPELASGSLSRSIIMEIMVNEPELTGDALKAALIQELNDAKSSLTSSLDEMMQAALTAQMLFSYLKGEDGKNGAWDGELAALTDTQKEKAFIIALQSFNSESSKEAFNPESYPEEFVNLLVVRGSELAEKRYQDFLEGQDLPGSVSEEERPGLNLNGIPVFFQKQILARDFHAFLDNASALTDFDAFSSLSGFSNSEILGAYFESRKMEPRQTGLLNEILAVRQWNEMKAEADARAGTDFPDNLLEADESEYSADFQDYIFGLRLKDFLADKTVTGSTIAEQKESFAVLFQQFLDDPAYSVNGKSLRERIASTDETAYLEDLGFEIQRQELEANSLLPGALYQRFLDGELNDPVPDEFNVLPDEFADILANHSDYLAMAEALTDSSQADSGGEENFVEILALLETGGHPVSDITYGKSELANSLLTDRILADTGYEHLNEPALSFVRSYINQDIAYQSVGGADLQTAIVETERAAITEDFFPTEGDLLIHQAFLEDHGGDLNALSGAVSQALEGNPDFKDSPLFTYYLNQRGDLVQSLLEKASGANSDFYNSLSAEEKSDFDELKTVLHEDELLTEELQLRSDKAATSLNHSAMQNLAQSGTIPAMSSMALGYFSQRLSDADFELLKENRQALGRALISAILESGDEAALSGGLPAILSSADVADGIQYLISRLGPQFKAGILDQASLWRTYMGEYAISDAKRDELDSLIENSQGKQNRLRVDLSSGTTSGVDLMQERLDESGKGSAFIMEIMGGYLRSDTKALESLARQADRDFKIASRLSEFADLRGSITDSNGEENLTVNRFVNYRTYVGAERQSQLNSYRDYLRSYNPGIFVDLEGNDRPILDAITEKVAAGETVWIPKDGLGPPEIRAESSWDAAAEDGLPDHLSLTVGQPEDYTEFQQFADLTGTAVIEVEEVDLQGRNMDNLFDSDGWEEILASDPPSQGADPETVDDSRIWENGEDTDLEVRSPAIRAVMPYNGREVESLEDMKRVYYANLANNYLDHVSELHNALRTVLGQAQATQDQQDALLETEMSDAIVEALVESEENLEAGDETAAINSDNFENLDYEELKTLLENEENVADLKNALEVRDAALTGQIDGLTQDRVNAEQVYQSALSARSKAQKEYAQAGRRQESQDRAVRDYFNTVMVAVEQDYEEARTDYEQAEEQANELRDRYQEAMEDHTSTLDQMSGLFEKVNASQQELDTRSRVQEYANTPYLYASADSSVANGYGSSNTEYSAEGGIEEAGDESEEVSGESIDAYELHSEDADEAFERALAAYNSTQRQFKEAGFDVLLQDDLDDFSRVAQLRKDGNDLLDDELEEEDQERLTELQESKHSDFEGHQPYEVIRELFGQLSIEQLQEIAELGADPDDWELSDGLEQYREELEEIHGFNPGFLDSDDEEDAPEWQIAEEAELYLLTLRDLNERYGELIDARAEYIFHTQRTVRLEKAATLVQAEIDKRKAVVQKAKARFQEKLNQNFGDMTGPGSDGERKNARDFVYRMISNELPPLDPDGDSEVVVNLGAEYSSWFYGAGTVAREINRSIWGGNLDPTQYQWSSMQQLVAATGLSRWESKSAKEREAIRTWMKAGGATALGYENYVPVHMNWLQSLGHLDRAIKENQITRSIWLPVLYKSATEAVLGAFVGSSHSVAVYRQAAKMLSQGEARLVLQQINSVVASLNVGRVGDNTKVAEVRRAELRYQRAQANLDYLTKAPNLRIMKKRLRDFGNVLGYEITEGELNYLYDSDPNQASLNPDDQDDALNISKLSEQAKCFGSTGRRHSCDSTNSKEGGLHENDLTGDGVQVIQPNVQINLESQATQRPEISAEAETEEVYNLGRLLSSMVRHGNALRSEAKSQYIEKGRTAEPQFALSERSRTIHKLLKWASGSGIIATGKSHGGREFQGFRTVFQDQLENAKSIQQRELEQRSKLQKESWKAREESLKHTKELWEQRMETIMDRGQDQWATAENAFLARWHDARSEEEQRIRVAEDRWNTRIENHHAEKAAWENRLRKELAKKTIRENLGAEIDELNAQIRSHRSSLKSDLPTIDRAATINDAVEEVSRQSLNRESLESINESIERFDSNVKLQMESRGLGAPDTFDLMKDFRQELDHHNNRMKVLARIQVLEEYRNLIDKFVESIQKRNKSYRNRTESAALSSGFVRMDGVFLKKGLGGRNVGLVNPVNPFDIQGKADRFKADSEIFSSRPEFRTLMNSVSKPEFDAILHTEKLKAQNWMQGIAGSTREKVSRARSRDCDVLGDFGCWMGRAPDGKASLMADQMAGKDVSSYHAANQHSGVTAMIHQFAGGLGELGGESRPGQPGIPGFYLQMKFMNEQVSRKSSENIAKRGPFIDPITGAMNKAQLGSVQAYHDLEVGTRVYGRNRGKLIRAGGLVLGATAVQAGAIYLDGGASLGLYSAGAGILTAGIKADVRTGRSTYEFTTGDLVARASEMGSSLVPKGWAQVASALGAGIGAARAEYQRGNHDGRALGKGILSGLTSYGISAAASGNQMTGSKPLIQGSENGFGTGFRNSILNSMTGSLVDSTWELGRRSLGLDHSYNASVSPGLKSWTSIVGGALNAGLGQELKAQANRDKEKRLRKAWKEAKRTRDESGKQTVLDIFLGATRDEEKARKLARRFNEAYGKASVRKAIKVRSRQLGRSSREGKLSSAADVAAAEIVKHGDRNIQEECYIEIDRLSQAAGMSVAEATELVIRKYGGDPTRVLSEQNLQNLGAMDKEWSDLMTGPAPDTVGRQPGPWETFGAIQSGIKEGGDSVGVDSSHPLARIVRAKQMHKHYGAKKTEFLYQGTNIYAPAKVGQSHAYQLKERMRDRLRKSMNKRFGKGSYQEYLIYRKHMQEALDRYDLGEGFQAHGFKDRFKGTERFLKYWLREGIQRTKYLVNDKSWDQITREQKAFEARLDQKAADRKERLRAKIATVLKGNGLETGAILGAEIQTRYKRGMVHYEIAEMVTTELITLGAMKAFTAGKLAYRGYKAARLGSNAHKLRLGMGAFNKFRKSSMAARIGSTAPGRAILNKVYRNKYTLNSMAINGATSGAAKIPLDMTVASMQGEEYTLSDAYSSFGQGFFTGAGSSAIGGTRLLNDTGKIIGNGAFLGLNEIYQTMPEHGWGMGSERFTRTLIQAGFGMGSQALGIYGTRGSAPLTRFEYSYKGRQANDWLQGTVTPMPFDLANDAFWEVAWPRIQ